MIPDSYLAAWNQSASSRARHLVSGTQIVAIGSATIMLFTLLSIAAVLDLLSMQQSLQPLLSVCLVLTARSRICCC